MGTPSVVIAQGMRSAQEDQYCIHSLKTKGLNGWLLAVFDGHNGSSAAEHCRRYLFDRFRPQDVRHVSYALGSAIKRLAQETVDFRSGTTLSAVCILEDHDLVITGVVGDSVIAVRSAEGRVWRSSTHNVGVNTREREAAVARGAEYVEDGSHGYIRIPGNPGELQLGRALGDSALRSILSNKPDMHTVHSPTHVLLATDGILNNSLTDEETLNEIMQCVSSDDASAHSILGWRKNLDKLQDNTTIMLWKK